MAPSKQERQKAAQLDAAKRVAKRALTLSLALLRADALADGLEREVSLLESSGQSDDEHTKEAVQATKKMETTPFLRADAYFALLLAVLYSVVEKWRAWHFADPAVDRLLDEQGHVRKLQKYRHAVFHADLYDHEDIATLAQDEALREWTAKLASALRAYFTAWHRDPISHVAAHVERGG